MNGSVDSQPLSLIDLVKILYFRRYVFLGVFGLIMLLGIWYVMSKDEAYQYSSFYSLGVLADGEYLESPKTMELRVKEIGYPAVLERQRSSGDGAANIDVVIDSPPNSGMVRLLTFAPESIEEEVVEVHKALIAFIDSHQTKRYEHQKEEYETELKSVLNILNTEPSGPFNSASLPVLLQKKAELERSLRSMVPGDAIVTARVSDEPAGLSKVIIVLGLLILSTVFGLIIAYLAEFLAVVRDSLKRDSRYGG